MISLLKHFLSKIVCVKTSLKEKVYLNSHDEVACAAIYENDDLNTVLLLIYNDSGEVNGWDHSGSEYIHRLATRIQEPLLLSAYDKFGFKYVVDVRVELDTHLTHLKLLGREVLKLRTKRNIVLRATLETELPWVREYPMSYNLARLITESMHDYCDNNGLVYSGCN